MKQLHNQTFILVSIVIISVAYAALAGFAVYKEGEVSEGTNLLWSVIFALIIALWTDNDAKLRKLHKPYEYSFFVFLFWPFVLPYHLVKTRKTEGFVMFLGIVFMYVLPMFIGLIVWVYYVPTS